MSSAAKPRVSPVPALSVLCALLLLLGVIYHGLYRASAESLEQAERTLDRLEWIAVAAPEWRAQIEASRQSLRNDPPLPRASQPQEAAAELQRQLRQALMAAGGSIDSVQSSIASPSDWVLPSIRATIVTRMAPERVMDALSALEQLKVPLGFESVDIAIQQMGGKDAQQRVATLSIAVRTFVLEDDHANE